MTISIMEIQNAFIEAGYQFQEHVFNDGQAGNCLLELTRNKSPHAFDPDTGEESDFIVGRCKRYDAWRLAHEWLKDLQGNEASARRIALEQAREAMTYARKNPCPECGHNEWMASCSGLLDTCLQCGQDDLPSNLVLDGEAATEEKLGEPANDGSGKKIRDELLCYGRKGWIQGYLASGLYFKFNV